MALAPKPARKFNRAKWHSAAFFRAKRVLIRYENTADKKQERKNQVERSTIQSLIQTLTKLDTTNEKSQRGISILAEAQQFLGIRGKKEDMLYYLNNLLNKMQ